MSYPIGVAADRFHPLRLAIVGLTLYGLIMDADSIFTAWASLSQRLLPRARFAEIGSAGGILGSVVGIFFSPLVGEFLDTVHHQYRYTLFIGCGLAVLALGFFIILHGRFMALGGPKNYVAPE